MQLFGASSSEDGITKGLGFISNKVEKFSAQETKGNKIPHVGFNEVKYDKNQTNCLKVQQIMIIILFILSGCFKVNFLQIFLQQNMG